MDKPGLLTFPCEFQIKALGHASEAFEIAVLTIIREHFEDIAETAIQIKPSKNGNYLSMSITVHATSQEQLDNAYRALSNNEHIVMVL